MTTESLSDKEVKACLYENGQDSKIIGSFFPYSDVREAVKKLKENINNKELWYASTRGITKAEAIRIINEIFGSKLI